MTFSDLSSFLSVEQPKLRGWCCPDKANALVGIVMGHKPKISLEIGIFGGSSFLPIAMAHKLINLGTAIGIDPWDRGAGVQAQTTPEDKAWWANHVDLELYYREFVGHIDRLQLKPFTVVHRMISDKVLPPAPIGLLHVDGAHSDQAITDVARFAPNVEVGGYCVLDDLNWHGGGVIQAERRLLQMGFRKLYAVGTGAVYSRVR